MAWAKNFAAQLDAQTPETFGLTVEQAADWAAKVAAFETLYDECTEPTTRTPSKIQAKRDAKDALVAMARTLVRIVQGYPGTTDVLRADLRITIRDTDPTPVPVPDTSPRLEVVVVQGRQITIRLRPAEGDGRAKPAGVRGASVYYATGDDYPQDITGWAFKGNQTKTTVTLTIPDDVPGGTKVWLTAAWFNTKAQAGPACPSVETRIAGGLTPGSFRQVSAPRPDGRRGDRSTSVPRKKTRRVKAAIPEQSVELGGLRFGGAGASPKVQQAEREAAAEVEAELKAAKRKVKAARKKFDPAQEAFARELKDRWLEQMLAPTQARYRVTRQVEANPGRAGRQVLGGETCDAVELADEGAVVKRLNAA